MCLFSAQAPPPLPPWGSKSTCPDVFCAHWEMIQAGVINPLVPVTAVSTPPPDSCAHRSPSLPRLLWPKPPPLLTNLLTFSPLSSWPARVRARWKESYGQAPGCLQTAD